MNLDDIAPYMYVTCVDLIDACTLRNQSGTNCEEERATKRSRNDYYWSTGKDGKERHG